MKHIVAEGAWPSIGTVIYDENTCQPWKWFPKLGALDESQIDRTGAWLLIKENLDGQDDEDNRIISLVNDDEHIITDRAGPPATPTTAMVT